MHRPEFISGQSWPLLDFCLCGFSAGLCRSSLASPSRCLSESAPALHRLFLLTVVLFSCKNLAWLFSWRLWLGSGSCSYLVIGTVSPVVPLLLFLGHSPFCRWWRPSLFEKHRIEKRSVFLFSAPQISAWGPCFRSVGWVSSWLEWWLPLVEVFGVVSRSPSSAGGFSPFQVPWVPVYLVSLALALSSCCLRHVQFACSSRCHSCSSHPSPAWFSS